MSISDACPTCLTTKAQPLHIALVTETYPPEINGVAMTLGRMVEALRRRNHRVSIARPRQPGELLDREAADDILVKGLPIPGHRGLHIGLPSHGRLASRWRLDRPDIVHIATEGPLGRSAMAAANALGIPTVAGFHTNFHRYSRHYHLGWLQQPINAYLRSFHNRADMTLAPTRALQGQLVSDGYVRVEVMARGVDAQLFNPARRDPRLRHTWGIAEGGLAVIHVGRLAPEKNLSLLIEGFESIKRQHPGSRLILVGSGPLHRQLQRRHPGIVFAGARTGEDLARHYASADLFLFPSLTETFGNVLLEAMASGLAVLAFDYAAAAEHVVDGRNGLKAAYGDAGAFLTLARTLCDAPEKIGALGHAARDTALGLSWDAIFDRLIGQYRELLGRQRVTRGT